MAVLTVHNVTKKIRNKTIVDNISFEVKEGEIFGFLGPNGAGKTTTIRMLVGLIKPTSGTITIGRANVQTDFKEAMKQVGSIVETPELYTYLTGYENLKQFARMLRGVSEEKIQEIITLVQLDGRIHEKVKNYSLGMKQRLGIAQALLGSPKLLILDEPTNGLDPAGIKELREFVKKLVVEENISVFISSHMLSEIQMMCDRVAIINKGQMITTANVQALIEETSNRVEWKVDNSKEAAALLQKEADVKNVRVEEDKIECQMPVEKISECNALFVKNHIQVSGVRTVTFTLEDLFMELTGGDGVA